MMPWAVESWANDYGAPVGIDFDGEPDDSLAEVEVEIARERWAPLTPACPPAPEVIFVDGAQQMDARIWVTDANSISRMGVCVSFAAGWVRCDGAAQVEETLVDRAVFAIAGFGSIECPPGICYTGVPTVDTTPGGLDQQVQRYRDALEVKVAQKIGPSKLIVIDGHLSRREGIAGAVGYIKSHLTSYLPDDLAPVVGRLAPGQRTPLFLLEASGGYSRYTWYLKLPGGAGHPWAGVVRCEATSSLSPMAEVVQFADTVSATLPKFASEQYKDSRAPQNLYPVAGLERELRRRMGDRELLLRCLRRGCQQSG